MTSPSFAQFTLEISDESAASEALAAQNPVYVLLPIFFACRAL
jgi:hypothetical protein